jgi:hypothetical protein
MAQTAEEANRLARETPLSYTRPWIGGRARVANVAPGHKPTMAFTYKNYGSSPAFHLSAWSGIRIGIDDITQAEIVYITGQMPVEMSGTVYPGEIFYTAVVDAEDVLSTQDMEDIKAGKLSLIGIGAVRYQDFAGKVHHAWIVAKYIPQINEMILFTPPDLPPDD